MLYCKEDCYPFGGAKWTKWKKLAWYSNGFPTIPFSHWKSCSGRLYIIYSNIHFESFNSGD